LIYNNLINLNNIFTFKWCLLKMGFFFHKGPGAFQDRAPVVGEKADVWALGILMFKLSSAGPLPVQFTPEELQQPWTAKHARAIVGKQRGIRVSINNSGSWSEGNF